MSNLQGFENIILAGTRPRWLACGNH